MNGSDLSRVDDFFVKRVEHLNVIFKWKSHFVHVHHDVLEKNKFFVSKIFNRENSFCHFQYQETFSKRTPGIT